LGVDGQSLDSKLKLSNSEKLVAGAHSVEYFSAPVTLGNIR